MGHDSSTSNIALMMMMMKVTEIYCPFRESRYQLNQHQVAGTKQMLRLIDFANWMPSKASKLGSLRTLINFILSKLTL